MKTLSQKLELFREKYREGYAGILPPEVLEQGNPWFENFLSQTVKELLEEMVMESKSGIETQIPCPDKMPGCLVYHVSRQLTEEEKGYNSARQDQLERLKKIMGE